MTKQKHHGSCLCGAVRFAVCGELRGVTVCHCTQCRKSSGHQWGSVVARRSEVEIDDGESLLTWFASSDFAKRGFCQRCGSSLFWKHNEEETISILAGSFDTPVGLRIVSHIFTDDAGDYYDIPDDVPCHRGLRS